MYKKARAGQIKDFTGISAVYEEPKQPEIVLETDKLSLQDCIKTMLDYLVHNGYIKQSRITKELAAAHESNI